MHSLAYLLFLYYELQSNSKWWVGCQKSYVILRVGLAKCLCFLIMRVGGSKKGLKVQRSKKAFT